MISLLSNPLNGFVYPKLISNEELYRLTKQIPWSAVCRERRLKLLGHIMRLHEQSPAAQAFSNALQPAKAKIGRPKLTWLKLITQDLINYLNIFPDPNFNNVKILCQNRDQWRTMVGNLRNAGSPAAKWTLKFHIYCNIALYVFVFLFITCIRNRWWWWKHRTVKPT